MKKAAPDNNSPYILILILVVLLTYSSSIFGVFLLDDQKQILSNPYTKSFKYLGAILSGGFEHLDKSVSNYYRPIVEISYIPDYLLWGTDPKGYHLTNILIHTLTVIILFFLLNALFDKPKISFFTSLVFAVHPIYTSAVTYLSGRGDLLMIFFVLLSLFFFVKYLKETKGTGWLFLMISCSSYFLALLTKEASLIILAVVLLMRLFIKNCRKKWAPAYVLYTAATGLYSLIRSLAIKGFFVTKYEFASSISLAERLFTALASFLEHFMILVMPVGLHLDRSIVVSRSFTDPKVLCGLILFCGILYMIFRLRKTKGPVFIGLAWFLLTYIPVSNLIIPLNTFVAENWIQLPAIGLFLALTGFVFEHSEHGLKTLFSSLSVFLIAVILFYAALTIVRNNDYYNPITFYEQNLKYEPKNVSSLYLLGREYAAKGEVVKAAELYNNALAIDPANSNSINNLANIYAQKNDYAKAISLYRQALSTDPENIMVLNNLAITYARIGDVTNAINCWEKSLKLDPRQPSIRQYIDFYKENGSPSVVIRKVP